MWPTSAKQQAPMHFFCEHTRELRCQTSLPLSPHPLTLTALENSTVSVSIEIIELMAVWSALNLTWRWWQKRHDRADVIQSG